MEGKLNGKLVGDSGYPVLPFLLTPIGNPQTDEELMYIFMDIHIYTYI